MTSLTNDPVLAASTENSEHISQLQGSQVSACTRRHLLGKPPEFWARLVLGLVFVLASMDKIIHPLGFAQIIVNYQALPSGLINITAILLPWLELLLGLFLIFGIWLPGAIVLTDVLLIVFWSVLVFNVARGLDVHCGCFSTSMEGKPATAWYVIRDSGFLFLGGYLLYKLIGSGR